MRVLMLTLLGSGFLPVGLAAAQDKTGKPAEILIIDGAAGKPTEHNTDGYDVRSALEAANETVEPAPDAKPGKAGGLGVSALERADLSKFKSIFVLDVPELTAAQRANLEKYVEAGGGVAFFLGPRVSSPYYNQHLYSNGKGLFPVPLKKTCHPPLSEPGLKDAMPVQPQVLLRDDLFPRMGRCPILGQVFVEPKLRPLLDDLHVSRFFPVDMSIWKPDTRKPVVLASLANDRPSKEFAQRFRELLGTRLDQVLEKNPALQKQFGARLREYQLRTEILLLPEADKKAFDLAKELEVMLNDPGKTNDGNAFPDLTAFWSDAGVATLAKDLRQLQHQARYGEPLIITSTYGKGRVVVVLTTAGKGWSNWAAGSQAAVTYAPVIWEMHRFLAGVVATP